MNEERMSTDSAALTQYVESILDKGKLPYYVGERPLVFPVFIGRNEYGNFYQLECKCQVRGSTYKSYPEQVSDVFPKCAKCIGRIRTLHKQDVYEKEKRAKEARRQARKEKQQREATRSLPTWAQWLLPIFTAVLAFVLSKL